jgi:mRNA degradation ribonuclease J1/J2
MMPVDHSIPGSGAFNLTIHNGHGSDLATVSYMGDFGEGENSRRAMQKAGASDIVILEGTRVGEKSMSTQVSKDEVRNNLREARERADAKKGIFLVQIPPNHQERLEMIREIAGKRKVSVTLPIALILHEYSLLNDRLPPEERIPVPRIGADVSIVKHKKSSYSTWETELITKYSDSVVLMDDVVKDPANYAVVSSPSHSLRTLFNGTVFRREDQNGVVVRSSYWPYNLNDKQTALQNQNYCENCQWEWASDFRMVDTGTEVKVINNPTPKWHYTGHARPEVLEEYVREMLDATDPVRIKEKKIVLTHTTNPRQVAELIRKISKEVQIYPDPTLNHNTSGSVSIPIPLHR